tara:strand:- start:428 stop:664 length:237 start_codon:yes stop_codon:yes gene_type:complete
MPKWKYIDKLKTYDDRFTAFKNELDNLIFRCFGDDHTYVTYKGNTITVEIDEKGHKIVNGEINPLLLNIEVSKKGEWE